MNNKKPDAVIVELCQERFIAISLDAQILPRTNVTLIEMYEKQKLQLLKKYAKEMELSPDDTEKFLLSPVLIRPKRNFVQQIISAFRFAKSQGMLGGLFVLLGLSVGSLQKLTNDPGGDEFVTAMRIAEEQNIPVLLGDAPQNQVSRYI